MKFNKIAFGLFLLMPLLSTSQLLVDWFLFNNSEKWKSKTGMAIIANQLRKVSLGPIETISIDKREKNVKSLITGDLKVKMVHGGLLMNIVS